MVERRYARQSDIPSCAKHRKMRSELVVMCAISCVVFFVSCIAFAVCIYEEYRLTGRLPGTVLSRLPDEVKLLNSQFNKHARGVVMSCPVGPSRTHQGSWKPRNMVRGVEAVARQLHRHRSRLPLFFGYYIRERSAAEPWCNRLVKMFAGAVQVVCFLVS